VILVLVAVGGFYTYLQMKKPKSPTGEVVLVVKGRITRTNVGNEYHFDLAMLEKMIDTKFEWDGPWFGKHTYEGVSLVTLLKELGVPEDAKYIKFVAKDGLTAEYPISMLKEHPKIILAIKMDGDYIPDDMVGPLRVIIPYDQYPELEEEYPPYPYTIGWIIEAEVG
jgi:hypothetical protein